MSAEISKLLTIFFVAIISVQKSIPEQPTYSFIQQEQKLSAHVKKSLISSVVGSISCIIHRNKHKHLSHDWSIEQFKKYFRKKLGSGYCKDSNKQREILSHHELYDCMEFREFIMTLPELGPYLNQFRKAQTINREITLKDSSDVRSYDPTLEPVYRFIDYLDSRQQSSGVQTAAHTQKIITNVQKESISKRLEQSRIAITQQPLCLSQNTHEYNHVLQKFLNNQATWRHKTYIVSAPAKTLLQVNHYNPEKYVQCDGIELQQVMHSEYVHLIEKAAINQLRWQQDNTKIFLSFIDCGREHNQAGSLVISRNILNVCWAFYDGMLAVGEGVIDGVTSLANSVAHPIEMAQNLGAAVLTLGKGIAQLTAYTIDLAVLKCTDQLAFEYQIHKTSKAIDAIANALYQQITMHPHEAIRNSTAVLTESMVTGKLFSTLSVFFDTAKMQLPFYLEHINHGLPPLAVAAVGNQAMVAAAAVEATAILQKIDAVLNGAKDLTLFMQSFGPCIPIAKQLPELEKIYKDSVKGFGEQADKYVDWEDGLKHIFEIKIKQAKNGKLKIDGFHHDPGNFLEKMEVIKLLNKKEYPDGFYKADVLYNGVLHEGKTFFPADWSREKVVKTIIDFYESKKDLAIKEGNRWRIEDFFCQKTKIRIIIENTMKSVTSYPVCE